MDKGTLINRKLIDALGGIYPLLRDKTTLEVMANCDSKVYVERLGEPPQYQFDLEAGQAALIAKLVAASNGDEAVPGSIIEGTLCLDDSRFTALMPPLTKQTIFTIRKKALKIFTLEDYRANGAIDRRIQQRLQAAVVAHQNIVVVGGTGSGKTTLANALIHSISELTPDDRLVVIEDTHELQPCSVNQTILGTTQNLDMGQLLRATLRLRPDRIIIGEVRGAEALILLKAWGTGHPGGVCTVHANSALDGVERLTSLARESGTQIEDALVTRTVNLFVYIEKSGSGRRVKELYQPDCQSSTQSRRAVGRGDYLRCS